MATRLVTFMIVLAFGAVSFAGAVRHEREEGVVKSAKRVFVAEITALKAWKEACGAGLRMKVKPVRWLKGKDVSATRYDYSTWHPRYNPKERCPSVHYVAPPEAPGLKKGLTVIAVIGGSRYSQPGRVYGTFALTKLKQVREWLKTKGKK